MIADVNAKVKGFSAHAEYFYNSVDVDSISERVEPTGFYTQLGYFIVPKKFEIAARYGRLDCDSSEGLTGDCEDSERINETGVYLNYFFWKHLLKAQLAYANFGNRAIASNKEDLNTNKWVFQLSSMF